MKKILLAIVALALASCDAAPESDPEELEALALEYIAVQLAIGEKDSGYIDAYYGPEDLAQAAKDNDSDTTLEQLQSRVASLDTKLADFNVADGSLEAERVDALRPMLHAARTRLRVLAGEELSFQDEAEGLFGVRPELVDLSSLDPILARIEEIVPGDADDGPLSERVSAFRNRFVVPEDKVRAVIDAAVTECRHRTLEHVELPAEEGFELELVTDKPWTGYNYYQGAYRSKIEINVEFPIKIDRAVDIGCHEGYPGHHVYSTLVERDLTIERGWIENSLMPLYSPRAIIAEGSAQYAKTIAFPGETRKAFDRDVLAPLAGIDASAIDDYYELARLLSELEIGSYAIPAAYLDGTATKEETIAANMRYTLVDRERAEQEVSFFDTYRTYTINYAVGEKLVADYVEAAGDDRNVRWKRFIGILNTPTYPDDLSEGA
ncbi:MAG: hypothetical protein AAF251_16215 [Pseudomonadota bacterium]